MVVLSEPKSVKLQLRGRCVFEVSRANNERAATCRVRRVLASGSRDMGYELAVFLLSMAFEFYLRASRAPLG